MQQTWFARVRLAVALTLFWFLVEGAGAGAQEPAGAAPSSTSPGGADRPATADPPPDIPRDRSAPPGEVAPAPDRRPTGPVTQAEGRPGQLTVIVFLAGEERPLGRVAVSAAGTRGATNDKGGVRLAVPPGQHAISLGFPPGLLQGGASAEIPIGPVAVVAGETTEVIATVGLDGRLVETLVEAPQQAERRLSQTEDFERRKRELPSGSLEGVVVSLEGKKPVSNARIFVRGAPVEAVSDAQGRFKLAVPEGEYGLSIIHPDFSTQTIPKVPVRGGASTPVRVELSPSAHELEEFVVVAPHLEGSLASVLDERRGTAEVAEVLGAEQMSKAGDSDAADALKRVTGLTLIGGKYIYVRGLGERYSSTLLNGAELPSPDPTRRVIPLDLFPTGVLGSVVVQKTYSPDMPGDFSGGVVQLRTRGLPEKFELSLSLKGGVNTQSTLRKGRTYEGGRWDFLGFDDGTRDAPSEVLARTGGGKKSISSLPYMERQNLSALFDHSYETKPTTLPPGFGVEVAVGDNVALGPLKLGYAFGGEYDNGWSYRKETRGQLQADQGPQRFKLLSETNLRRTQDEVNVSGIANFGIKAGQHHTVESVTLATRKSLKITTIDFTRTDSGESLGASLRWNEQELLAQQVRGTHTFPVLANLGVDWMFNVARATRTEPDAREYAYERLGPGDPFSYTRRTPLYRGYEDLQDDSMVFGANARLPVKPTASLELTPSVGFLRTATDRTASVLRYRFEYPDAFKGDPTRPIGEIFSRASVLGPPPVQVENANPPTDSYRATYETTAFYVMADAHWVERLRLQGGARIEAAKIEATSSSLFNPDEAQRSSLEELDVLPGGTATVFLPGSTQVRGAYSQTVNRPQLRELSEIPYQDPETGLNYYGNPKLGQASVRNYDLRFEWYWSSTESLSVAGFLKQFENPIEQAIVPGSGDLRTPLNIPEATNYGLEIDARHELDWWVDALEGVFVAGNVSLIRSEVTIPEQLKKSLTTTKRPLEGQSPWVVNGQLGYTSPDEGPLDVLLSFNMFGRRIVEVGQGGIPDAYEQAAPFLDLTARYRLGKHFKVGLKGRNLLNAAYEVLQGGLVRRRYKTGVSGSLSLSYDY